MELLEEEKKLMMTILANRNFLRYRTVSQKFHSEVGYAKLDKTIQDLQKRELIERNHGFLRISEKGKKILGVNDGK